LEKIAADYGIDRVAQHIVAEGSGGIGESDFVALVQKFAPEGKTVGEVLATDAVLAKAASVCRYSGYENQSRRNMVDAHLRRAAQS
jgi:hypothetical protein